MYANLNVYANIEICLRISNVRLVVCDISCKNTN